MKRKFVIVKKKRLCVIILCMHRKKRNEKVYVEGKKREYLKNIYDYNNLFMK